MSMPSHSTTVESQVPIPERSTVWSKSAYAAFPKHSARSLPNALTMRSAVWSIRT